MSKTQALSQNIRNFCIIAHIDHGKSTLADRLLDFTGSVTDREKQDQLLDDMDLERERGITIKSHAVQMDYKRGDESFILNLIDTPGHVDFSYEVSRALIACDGAILLVDATQGIQAQTFAHSYAAIEAGLEIIPVLNKIDSIDADKDSAKKQIFNLIGSSEKEIFEISAKTGDGVKDLLDAIPELVSPPVQKTKDSNALIFDSFFDSYRGVVASVRVFGDEINMNQKLRLVNSKYSFEPTSNCCLGI